MSKTQVPKQSVEVQADSIGGINETEVAFFPGVTILTGRNATNRTSFPRAIMAALRSDYTSSKGDADEGYAELTVGDNTYRRVLERERGTVVMGSEPYLDDSKGTNLFAFCSKTTKHARRSRMVTTSERSSCGRLIPMPSRLR